MDVLPNDCKRLGSMVPLSSCTYPCVGRCGCLTKERLVEAEWLKLSGGPISFPGAGSSVLFIGQGSAPFLAPLPLTVQFRRLAENCQTYPKTESLRYSLAFSHNSYSYPLILLVLYVSGQPLIMFEPDPCKDTRRWVHFTSSGNLSSINSDKRVLLGGNTSDRYDGVLCL